MFESFNKNSKKNGKGENKKPRHNLPGIRNYDQFPGENGKYTGGPNIPFLTFTPPSPPLPPLPPLDQHQAQDAGGKQILLQNNNFSKSEGEKKKKMNKEAKQKMWTQSSLKNKKKNKTEDSRVPTGKKPKPSSKQKEKPMKTPKQKNKDNSVIIEFETETKNEVPSAVLNENTGTKVSFERKGFQRKSSGAEGPSQEISKGDSTRLSDVLKVFKIEKERKEKKTKSPLQHSLTNNADLLMSGESVKDKYITNNFGPRLVEKEDEGDSDTDSPPLVHFGNIPTDVDLIGNIFRLRFTSLLYRLCFAGMRIKNSKDSRKSKLSNLQPDEEEEDGKFSGESILTTVTVRVLLNVNLNLIFFTPDILKFLSKKDRTEGKVKKNKKAPPLSKKPRDQPKCRSIDEINKMLADIADNKSTGRTQAWSLSH